jgi:hypothetical protein
MRFILRKKDVPFPLTPPSPVRREGNNTVQGYGYGYEARLVYGRRLRQVLKSNNLTD